MPKQIKLTKGKYTIVDNWNFEWLNQHKWFAKKNGTKWYAMRKPGPHPMHKEILNLRIGDNIIIDHINQNSLDNREHNLRIANNSINAQNKKLLNKTGFRGLTWKNNKWQVEIGFNRRKVYIGRFNNVVDAAKAYDKKAKELFGKFAATNF
jgi:hypothetical protein